MGNAENGKKIATGIGLYIIIKSVLNLILGGGFMSFLGSLILAVVFLFMLVMGVKYTNYIVGVWCILTVATNVETNVANLGFNKYLIYLIEGIIDLIAGVMLFANNDIKAHFEGGSNK